MKVWLIQELLCKNTRRWLLSYVSPIGQNNSKDFFFAQSGDNIQRAVWNLSGKTLSPGVSSVTPSFLCWFFFPHFNFSHGPTNCPWVSDDSLLHYSQNTGSALTAKCFHKLNALAISLDCPSSRCWVRARAQFLFWTVAPNEESLLYRGLEYM